GRAGPVLILGVAPLVGGVGCSGKCDVGIVELREQDRHRVDRGDAEDPDDDQPDDDDLAHEAGLVAVQARADAHPRILLTRPSLKASASSIRTISVEATNTSNPVATPAATSAARPALATARAAAHAPA